MLHVIYQHAKVTGMQKFYFYFSKSPNKHFMDFLSTLEGFSTEGIM